MNRIILYILLFYSIFVFGSHSDQTIIYQNNTKLNRIGSHLSFYEDLSNELTILEVENLPFIPCSEDIPDFGLSKSSYWIKFTFNNQSDVEDFLLELKRIYTKDLRLYYKPSNEHINYIEQKYDENSKKHIGSLFFFDISIPKGQKRTFYLKFKTVWSYSFPMKISPKKTALKNLLNQELIGGIYLGIILIMVCYNAFIYFSVKDSSYLYYVLYIFTFLLFQFNELGYAYKYIWHKQPDLFHIFTKVAPILSCIAAIYFVRSFLKTKIHTPTLHSVYNFFIIALSSVLLTAFSNDYNDIYFNTLNILTFAVSTYTLGVAIIIMRKGFSPAKFFLIAWLVLLLSIIQFTLSNLGFIPYYSITDYSLEIGSIIEIVLLSFGLAYRVNVLMKEKEKSQTLALTLAAEKENIITQQKENLEHLVTKRTKKLERKNIQIFNQNEEKSTMMREIHHRVKNNLQMINSMIRMQSKFVSNNNSKEVLDKVQRRIIVMAQLHEKMYLSNDLKSIVINNYIENIITDIFNNNNLNTNYSINIPEQLEFNTENALSIGLLTNELVNNTLAYGFTEDDKATIKIQITQNNKKQYSLIFSDNRKEFEYDTFINNPSLAQRLIKNFIKQLDGTIIIEKTSVENILKINFST